MTARRAVILFAKAVFCLVMAYALTAMTIGTIAYALNVQVPLLPLGILAAPFLWWFLTTLEKPRDEAE